MTSIAIYDPRRLKQPDFLAGFVARGELVTFLLKQLQLIATDGEGRHRLILGQRGMGKTSLLRRLEIGITDDPDLAAALLPLTFREEQYNIRSLDRFWRNCGEALAEWLEKSGDAAGAAQLDAEMRGPEWQDNETAATAFLHRVAQIGRRAVLLLDNFDLILDALPDQHHWQLRRVLQAAGGPIIFGGATQAPRQSGDQHAAFYEFFRFDVLEPLTMAEVMTCLRSLALARGEAGKPVLEILQHKPERLRVLHSLTGGNPRILALLYQLLERADNETVFEDLEGLLDQLTPLYKARVEELRTELQRSILDAIALHWDPITSHDLAANTQVEITTLSSQLLKLKTVGLIEEVPTSGVRAGYQLVERFFNVWYLMRHGTRRTKQRMRWLTAFLSSFYNADELRDMHTRLASPTQAERWGMLYTEALEAALMGEPLARSASDATWQSGSGVPPVQLDAEGNAPTFDLAAAEKRVRARVRADPLDATAWVDLGHLLAVHLGQHEEATRVFLEAIRIDPANARAWNNLGILLTDHLGQHEEAARAYREAIRIDPADARAWYNLGNLLTEHLGQHEEAARAYREAIRIDPASARAWYNLGTLLAGHLGQHEEAARAFREAIRIDPAYAWAWNNLGNLLTDHLGQHEEAAQAYREAIRIDPTDALVWNNLGNLLADHMVRPQDADDAYREAIRLDPDNASARANLLWLAMADGRGDDANALRQNLARLDLVGVHLIDAGLAVIADNFGAATAQLGDALGVDLKPSGVSYFDDLLRLLRLFVRRGYGERLIGWFEATEHADRSAPIYAALVAYVRGANMLRDVNPEMRPAAERIHAWLASHLGAAAKLDEPRRRGRPRRVRGG